MALLNFPNTRLNGDPLQNGDEYTGDNGVTYIYSNGKWVGHSPVLAAGTNSIINNGYVVQVDVNGNLVLEPGKDIRDSNGNILAAATALNLGNYTFDGSTMHIPVIGSGSQSYLNAGGVGRRNSVQLRTAVNYMNTDINTSEIALEAGNGGFSAQVYGHWTGGADGSGGPTLVYAGVENVSGANGPGFAGMVAIDPGVTSQYAVAISDAGKIFLSVGEPVSTTEYTAALGVLTNNIDPETGIALLNGIATNPRWTALTGQEGISMSTDRGTVFFGNMPEPGLASHFHIMRENDSQVDLFFGDDFNYVKLPYFSTLTNIGVEISAANRLWKFNKDGTTTFPDNALDAGANGILIASQSNAELGYFNSDIQYTPNEVLDAFVGVDNNGPYFSNFAINDTADDINGSVWYIDSKGNLVTNVHQYVAETNSVGDITDAQGNSIIYTITSEEPPTRAPNGRLWYNSIEGRIYIQYENSWVEASPTVIPPPSTYLGGLTVDGTTISTVDSTGTVSIETGVNNQWIFNTDGTLSISGGITAATAVGFESSVNGHTSGLFVSGDKSNSNGNSFLYSTNNVVVRADNNGTSKDWVFDKDAVLSLPGDLGVGAGNGHIYIDDDLSSASSIRWVNMNPSSAMLRVWSDGRNDLNNQRLELGYDIEGGLYITTTKNIDGLYNNPADDFNWTFGSDGTTSLPVITSQPSTTNPGTMAVCDGTGWNGGGDGLQHLMIYINGSWTKVV
jgi:hypothetical protein